VEEFPKQEAEGQGGVTLVFKLNPMAFQEKKEVEHSCGSD